MRGVIISIGNELLRGDIIDSNAPFLARDLGRLGVEVIRVEQVGDALSDLVSGFERALADADITLSTGGLGPTADDLTRDAIAGALDEARFVDPGLAAGLERRFAAWGRRMPKRNLQQAELIPSAVAVPNPNGTAPGWLARREGRLIAAMPGPPAEMIPMWEDSVRPEIEALLPDQRAIRSAMTFGLGESTVEEQIQDVITWRPDVTVATYAKSHGVEVHVTARAASTTAAEGLAADAHARLLARLGSAVFGEAGETLAAAVGRALSRRHLSLAVMESCTGGLLSSLITDHAGASDHFLGGIVAYDPLVKVANGVDPSILERNGLYSKETAVAMAVAARRTLRADVGLAVTGIAGTESLEGKPPGTCFVGLDMENIQAVREIRRPGDRETIKRFAAQSALDLLRRQLDGPGTDNGQKSR